MSYIDTVKRFVGLTTDPTDPDLRRGFDEEPVEQGPKYLVLDLLAQLQGGRRVMFKPGTSVYKVNLYLPSSRLNGSVELITLSGEAAGRLALEMFFPEAGWQVTGCERVRSIDEHVAEESYLG